MMWFRDFFKNNQGASAVEFALVAPFLFLVMFLIIELSWLVSSQTVLNHATFQAARTAALARAEGWSENDAGEMAKTKAVANYWIGILTEDDVTVTFDESSDVSQVQVITSLEYSSLTGWFSSEATPAQIGSKAVTPY
jgi:Flp pilus assembly pilin Flp